MVECGFYAVRWDDFNCLLNENKRPIDLAEELEDQEVELSYSSMKRQMEFIDDDNIYRAFAPAWDASSREPFEKFFHALFPGFAEEDVDRPLDVPEERAEWSMLDTAWSPETVQRYAGLWRRVNLSTARSPFEEHVRDDFWDFERWSAFAREHGEIVERAAAEGKGLVQIVFG